METIRELRRRKGKKQKARPNVPFGTGGQKAKGKKEEKKVSSME